MLNQTATLHNELNKSHTVFHPCLYSLITDDVVIVQNCKRVVSLHGFGHFICYQWYRQWETVCDLFFTTNLNLQASEQTSKEVFVLLLLNGWEPIRNEDSGPCSLLDLMIAILKCSEYTLSSEGLILQLLLFNIPKNMHSFYTNTTFYIMKEYNVA